MEEEREDKDEIMMMMCGWIDEEDARCGCCAQGMRHAWSREGKACEKSANAEQDEGTVGTEELNDFDDPPHRRRTRSTTQ